MGPDGNPVYSWYGSFLESFALPNIDLFNTIVPLGEFLVGLGLILGCLTTTAIFFGLVMNFSFFLAWNRFSYSDRSLLRSNSPIRWFQRRKIWLRSLGNPYIRKITSKENHVLSQKVNLHL